ncbi:MAG: VPLPA-CTERM sorting domain-containing protein [Steroidobacteraceae bacterium]
MNTKLLKSMLVIAATGIAGSAYATNFSLGPLSPPTTIGISDFIPSGGSNPFTDNWNFTLSSTAGVGDNIFNLVVAPQSDITGLTAILYVNNGGTLTAVPGGSGLNFSVPSLGVLPGSETYDLQLKGTVTGTVGGGYGGTLSIVPLPAAAWLLLSGLAGVGAMARRRKIDA